MKDMKFMKGRGIATKGTRGTEDFKETKTS